MLSQWFYCYRLPHLTGSSAKQASCVGPRDPRLVVSFQDVGLCGHNMRVPSCSPTFKIINFRSSINLKKKLFADLFFFKKTVVIYI